jgi:hypothetical protein
MVESQPAAGVLAGADHGVARPTVGVGIDITVGHQALLRELCGSVRRAGFRRLLIANGHGATPARLVR